jgi:hypothetical protein
MGIDSDRERFSDQDDQRFAQRLHTWPVER